MSLPPAVGSAKPDGAGVNADDYRPTVWRVWGVSFDARIVQVVTVATVILILAFNNRFVEGEYDRFVLEFLIPVAIVVLAWREDPRRYGVALGWSFGRKYGSDAIWLQVIPFALMHVWKPEIEQLSTLVGGALFGLLAWRARSFLWGWLLHWFMLAWVLVVAAGYV